MRRLLMFLLLWSCVAGNPPANAGLVTNGGFETGDFSGWQHFYDETSSDDGVFARGGLFEPASGNFAAYFSAFNTTTSGISQVLSTTSGQIYTLSFQLSNIDDPIPDIGLGNSYLVQVGNVTLFSGNDVPASPYTVFSTQFTATSSESVLTFTFNNEISWFLLDDVNVDALAAVPEPSSFALLSLAIGGLGLYRVRRRRDFSD